MRALNFRFCILALGWLGFVGGLRAQSVDTEIEATVTVTAGTTNGQTIAYGSDTRTFTNNPAANPSKQLQATNTIGFVTTNLNLHFLRFPFPDGIYLESSGTNYIKFLSQLNSNLSLSLSPGWGTVSYATNVYTNKTDLSLPLGFEGDPVLTTNLANMLIAGIGSFGSSGWGELVKALTNFVNVSQSQTVSNKNLMGGSASALNLKSAIMSGSNSVTFDMSAVTAELNGGGIRFGSTSSNTYAILVPTDNDPAKIGYYYVTNSGGAALFADVSGFTPYSSPYLLNLGSAIKIFPVIDGSLWPPNTQPTNNWKSANIWANGSNAFKGFLWVTGGVAIVSGTLTNVNGAYIGLTVTNLQALGGNLSGMTFSGLSGTGLQSSNTLRLGTNVILGDLSLGSGTITTVTPGYNVLDIGTNSYIRVTGSPGQDWIFTGVKAGAQRDGLFCFLDFQTGFNVTAANESAAVNTGNANQRLRTLNGGDSQSVGNALGFVVWDPGLSRWTFAWLNRGSQTANGTFATNAIPFANGTGTNLTVRSSDSNNIPLSVEGQLNQRSNLLQLVERTPTTTNVDSIFGPTGGLHIGGYSDAGGSNLVVDGMSDLSRIKTLNAGPLHRVTAAMAAGKTITVVGTMDSLICSGDFFGENLIELFTGNYYGYRGGGGNLVDLSFGPYTFNGKITGAKSAGASYVTDLNRWFGIHVLIPAGEQYRVGTTDPVFGFGWLPFTGNVYEAIFAVSNSYGGFTLYTNASPLTTIVCNTNAGILETNVVFRWTNSIATPVTLTAVCLSNSFRLFQLNIYDYTRPGVVWINAGAGGRSVADFNGVPTYARDAAWRAWNPDVVFLKTVNVGSVSISNNLAPFFGFVTSNCPNANFAVSGMHPVLSGDADIVAENVALKAFFQGRTNCAYWPAHEEFGDSFSIGNYLGYLKTSGDVHLTPQGSDFAARGMWDYLNFLNQKRPPANFPRMPFRFNTAGEIRFSGGTTYTDTNAFGVYWNGGLLGAIGTNGAILGQSSLIANGEQSGSNNITGTLNAGGATTLSNTLTVIGGAQLQASNNVTGTLSVGGTLTATGAVVVAGAENITGALNVGGNITATNNLTVTGFVSAGPGTHTASNATSVALVAVGGASATTNLTEVKNSAGQIVAGTTQDGVPFIRITNSPQNNLIGGRLFLQTASGTANTNTGATFQSWLGTGDGSLTIPSGLFNQYKQVKGEFNGNYWTSSGSAGNVYTELDIGGSPVMRQMTSTIGASIANGDFRLEFTITSRSVGSSGSAAVSGLLLLMSSSLNPVSYHFTNQVVTLDNRGALAIDFRGTNAQSTDSFITTDGIMFAR